MNREFLKELELEKDVIDKIMAEHGKAINEVKEKADKVDSLESQIEDYKTQLSDRDKQLEELGEKAKDNEELNNRIKELQDENKQTAQDYENKLIEQQKNFAIQSALRDANVHDPDLATKALDTEGITFKDGKLIGLDEQLNDLKANKAFLFKQEQQEEQKPNFTKGNHQKADGIDQDAFKKMSYLDKVKLKQTNPDQYNQLVGK